MKPRSTDIGHKRGGRLGWLVAALLVSAAVIVYLALFVTHGWADILMALLALATLVAAYAVRRVARRRMLYDHGDNNAAQQG
jgi:membrane protein implicated in regulation of membrane protease activity